MKHPAPEVACDFLSYLEWRLGTGRDATTQMLGEWLANYKSQRRSERNHPISSTSGGPPED